MKKRKQNKTVFSTWFIYWRFNVNYMFYVVTVIFAFFGIYILFKTKRVYEKAKTMPLWLSICWWILDIGWTGLVISSSIYGLWHISINGLFSRLIGSLTFLVGCVFLLAEMVEFHSLRKISGLEVSKLITTGIYRWSRNPQFLGFYLILVGISLFSFSGYALLLTAIAIIFCHYYIVKIEEPYLVKVFGEEYIKYKLRTPRYFAIKTLSLRSRENKC